MPYARLAMRMIFLEIQSDFESFIMVSDDPILISQYRHWEGVAPLTALWSTPV